jgi:hypothetical protein
MKSRAPFDGFLIVWLNFRMVESVLQHVREDCTSGKGSWTRFRKRPGLSHRRLLVIGTQSLMKFREARNSFLRKPVARIARSREIELKRSD